MSKKYEFTGKTMIYEGFDGEHVLHQIRAMEDIVNKVTGEIVPKGAVGGYIENEKNLSQKDSSWAYEGTKITGNAVLKENATLHDKVVLHHNAVVKGNATIFGNTIVCGNAVVKDESIVCGNAIISDNAKIYGDSRVGGNAQISGKAEIYEKAVVGFDEMSESLMEDYVPKGYTKISGKAKVHGEALVFEDASVKGCADISGDSCIRDEAFVAGDAIVTGSAVVRGKCVVVGKDRVDKGVLLETTPSKFKFQRPTTHLKPTSKSDDRNKVNGNEIE